LFPFPVVTAKFINNFFDNRQRAANCLVHFLSLNYFVGCDTKGDRSGEEDGHEEEDGDGEGDEEKGETVIAEGS
jgi:hypothetical protein